MTDIAKEAAKLNGHDCSNHEQQQQQQQPRFFGSPTTDFEFRPSSKENGKGLKSTRSKSPGAFIERLSSFARGKYRSSLSERPTQSRNFDERPRRVPVSFLNALNLIFLKFAINALPKLHWKQVYCYFQHVRPVIFQRMFPSAWYASYHFKHCYFVSTFSSTSPYLFFSNFKPQLNLPQNKRLYSSSLSVVF